VKVSFYSELPELTDHKFLAAITEFNDNELQDIMDVDLLNYGSIIQLDNVLLVSFNSEELFIWYMIKWL